MSMKPNLRKLVRTAHVIFTVGWLGTVFAFLVLAIAGLTSQDTQLARGVYPAMDLITRYAIVPLSLIPLLVTGPILSVETPWRLFRHYWIIVKLVINILSTLILLVHLQPIGYMAHVATERTLSSADRGIQIQLVIAAGAGLLALLVATGLAVIKPRGMTRYGWRKQYIERTQTQSRNDTT
jgi:hypothetical protein